MNEFAAPDGLSLDELKRCLAQIANNESIRAASFTAYDPATDVTGRQQGQQLVLSWPSSQRLLNRHALKRQRASRSALSRQLMFLLRPDLQFRINASGEECARRTDPITQ